MRASCGTRSRESAGKTYSGKAGTDEGLEGEQSQGEESKASHLDGEQHEGKIEEEKGLEHEKG